jgi:UDP-glucose 4-epimerase
MGRRVLVTGLGTTWGGRIARHLEADPDVEAIVGLDTTQPTMPLDRTEYVRTDPGYSILARIVKATGVDTIMHTALVVDSARTSGRRIQDVNVIGTLNLLAAAAQPASRVTTVIVKSSTVVYGAHHRDPVWFGEDTPRSSPPRHRIERSLVEVESLVRDFAVDNPHVTLTLLRVADVLGPGVTTSLTRALERPLVPSMAGFDPRMQFVDEDDVVRALLYVLDRQVGGVYNVAGDGLLPWSEVVAACGRRRLPLSPAGRHLLPGLLGRIGIDLPSELPDLLTYGRGVDTGRLAAAGFTCARTSAAAVAAFAETLRRRRTSGAAATGGLGHGDEPAVRPSAAFVPDRPDPRP